KRTGYRLPTEAEWEYAARAESLTSRSYGSSLALLPRYAWFLENSKPEVGDNHAWPVGQKRPNDLGFFDIHGNIYNWVYDGWYNFPEQQGTTATVDKEDIRDIKESVSRVLRGGSLFDQASNVRSAFRNYFIRPSLRLNYIGLRVSRTYH